MSMVLDRRIRLQRLSASAFYLLDQCPIIQMNLQIASNFHRIQLAPYRHRHPAPFITALLAVGLSNYRASSTAPRAGQSTFIFDRFTLAP